MAMIPDKNASLSEWQEFIAQLVAERGFTQDTNQVFVKFAEEVGELAKEVRRRWRAGAPTNNAAGELADVYFFLLDLANHFEVDLAEAARRKLAVNEKRHWLN